MEYVLDHNLPKFRLALNFNGKQLVCWAIVDLAKLGIGCWTKESCRKKGYARQTVAAILLHARFPKNGKVLVYRRCMCRLLRKLGYMPVFKEFWIH